MKNRGFTLIELLAIIIVLAAIFMVSFPSILNILRADEKKEYESMVKSICLAGKSYIEFNVDAFENKETIEFDVSELIEYGNVDSELINSKTTKSVSTDHLKYDQNLNCTYIDDNK